jgi:chemotaxis receptor (MCP) glutamine deamidase CheD
MFGSNLSNQIGLQNSAAVRQLLRDFEIRVMAEDCGGKRGRQLSFDVATGIATVAVLGNSPVVMQPSEQGAHE